MKIKSTRSNASADAHRDFDGFDEDMEIDLFEEAIGAGNWKAAALIAANLHEWISRGGSLPASWDGLSSKRQPSGFVAPRP